MESKKSRMLIVGLGNPILGDDGVGWKIAEQLKRQIDPEWAVDVDCASLGGISLMERLIGYERAILIDAFSLDAPVGSISVLKLGQLPNYSAFHIMSPHDTSLQNALELGKSMGADLPEDVTVVGVATQHVYDFSEELSPPVERVVPSVVQIVLGLLKEKMPAH